MANSEDPDQIAPIGAVCSGSVLFASILNLSVMLSNYLQQTTSADDIFRYVFFLGAFRVKILLLNNQQMSSDMRFPTMWYVRPAKAQTSLRIRAD